MGTDVNSPFNFLGPLLQPPFIFHISNHISKKCHLCYFWLVSGMTIPKNEKRKQTQAKSLKCLLNNIDVLPTFSVFGFFVAFCFYRKMGNRDDILSVLLATFFS